MSDPYLHVEDEPPVEPIGIEPILHQLLDVLATAKSMPLSSSVMVSREEVVSLLQSALDSLPEELRQARWLLRERDEFMAERTRDAEALLDEVRGAGRAHGAAHRDRATGQRRGPAHPR